MNTLDNDSDEEFLDNIIPLAEVGAAEKNTIGIIVHLVTEW